MRRRLACLRRIHISGTKGLQKPQISGTKVLHNLRLVVLKYYKNLKLVVLKYYTSCVSADAEVQLSVFVLRVACEIHEITTVTLVTRIYMCVT